MAEAVVRGWAVRPAQQQDLDAVVALVRTSALPTEGVADQFEDGFAVIEEDGRIIGVAGLEVYGGYGLLRSLAVAEAARGRGVAEQLMRDRIEWARARGLRAVYLLTTTAASYFARRGFAPVERGAVPSAVTRSPEFADVCPSSAVAMAITLEPRMSECCSAPVLLSARPTAGAAAASCCAPASPARGAASVDASDAEGLKAAVREKYGEAALRAGSGAKSSCCGASPDEVWDPITADLYDAAQTSGLPAEAVLASLGCGNPTALAELREGETVLDLGSGGGIDVLLSARRVGPTGKAYGLDMTDEMLELARANQRRAEVSNVEFLKGDIESMPLPSASIDVIISNCVINLAADKSKVLREAFRVLKPGGRFAVSDVVATREVSSAVLRSMELWMGCVAGALQQTEYVRLLEEAGFENVHIDPTRVYGADEARYFLEGAGIEVPADMEAFDGAFISAFIRATRPAS